MGEKDAGIGSEAAKRSEKAGPPTPTYRNGRNSLQKNRKRGEKSVGQQFYGDFSAEEMEGKRELLDGNHNAGKVRM
jgi:hypothetical protein